MKVLDSEDEEIELRDMDDEGDDVVNVDALSKFAAQQEQQAQEQTGATETASTTVDQVASPKETQQD